MSSDHTVYARFAQTARRWPTRSFMNVLPETARAYGIAPGEWEYCKALEDVEKLTDCYRHAGYGPGHRVGLLLENRPDFLRHFLALNAVGASIVPINPHLRAAELVYLTQHSEMVLAVAVPGRIDDLKAAYPGLTVKDPDSSPPATSPANGPTGEHAECALLYTSGTTGRPKGCMLSNQYFLHCGDWYAGVGGNLTMQEDPPERMLTPLPLFHTNALAWSAMAMITLGGCLTVLDRFHPKTWWDSVREARATVIHYLGIMPPLWMAEPACPADRDHNVRFGFGAGIDPALHEAAEARFGFPLIEGWAMTETGSGGVIMTTEDPRKPGTACFGRPRNGGEARVVRDDGTETDPDEPGELLVRRAGPDPRWGFFSGYLKDPQTTDEAWEGGWLHTGDVVSRDADGDLHFIDRKKNIVRRSGENISAAEVESVLGQHPAVSGVAIAPTTDDLRGEEVLALIVRANDDITPEQIADWCRQQMAYYKAPGWIAFVDALPVTATEKLQRGAIRDLTDHVMAEGQAIDLRHLKKRAV